ncbi:MAG: response regulator [Isosphaeraceae bacterium]
MRQRILVADDDPLIREHLRVILETDGHDVDSVGDGPAALEAVRELPYQLALVDLRLPLLDGLSLLATLRKEDRPICIILMAGPADSSRLPDAMRTGADEFVVKPYEPDQLRRVVARILLRRERLDERAKLLRPARSAHLPDGFVAWNPTMRRVASLALQLGPLDVPVLIQGERGTGKEFVARTIHRADARRRGPFRLASVDLGASDDLAKPGTLYFAELTSLDLDTQRELADWLRTNHDEDFGRRRAPRVVAATSRKLDAEVAAGRFDAGLAALFSRPFLELPPLSERSEDIPWLVRHFLAQAVPGGPAPEFAPDAMRALFDYSWPGNLPELQEVVAQAAAGAKEGRIARDSLPASVTSPATPPSGHRGLIDTSRPLPELLRDLTGRIEREYFTHLLARYRGNVARCAKHSGLSRKSVSQKLEKHALDRNQFKDGPAGA